MNPAHRVRRARAQTPFVVVREKLRLVRRHVDLHRTLALAAFTRKTQVERFLDGVAFPAVFDRLAADHFAEQTGTTTRRMLLLERDHVTRTHRSAMMSTANAGADATLCRLRKTVLVVGVLEMCHHTRRVPIRAQT